MINLGTHGVEAARALRGDARWDTLRAALGQLALDKMHAALDSSVEHRVEATAYARALRDLWSAAESATLDINARLLQKPKLKVS